MNGEDLLGIMPTGGGKSLCYQVPALSRYEKTSALTVVISPLVALMADQVAGLENRGITNVVAINGLLSMPERKDALDRVRLGDAAIVLISPEQLRSRPTRTALEQRLIGAWVLDEAHCLSKWGHDFRPDYRYIGKFIHKALGRGQTCSGPLPHRNGQTRGQGGDWGVLPADQLRRAGDTGRGRQAQQPGLRRHQDRGRHQDGPAQGPGGEPHGRRGRPGHHLLLHPGLRPRTWPSSSAPTAWRPGSFTPP